ncbi:MAG TPA: hypothetical protein VGE52_20625 [Pirellulales bacterium]
MASRSLLPTYDLTRRAAQALFVWALVWSVVVAVPRGPKPVTAAERAAPVATLAPTEDSSEPIDSELPDSLPSNAPTSNESSETPTHSGDAEEAETLHIGLTRRASSLPRLQAARLIVERLRAVRRIQAHAATGWAALDHSLSAQRGTASHLRC